MKKINRTTQKSGILLDKKIMDAWMTVSSSLIYLDRYACYSLSFSSEKEYVEFYVEGKKVFIKKCTKDIGFLVTQMPSKQRLSYRLQSVETKKFLMQFYNLKKGYSYRFKLKYVAKYMVEIVEIYSCPKRRYKRIL